MIKSFKFHCNFLGYANDTQRMYDLRGEMVYVYDMRFYCAN